MNMRALMAALAGLAMAASLMVPATARAWGAYGHRTIASIAWANTRPETHAAITRLLRSESELVTPQCPVKSLEDASAWPDCVRSEGWRWAYTFPWHYQDISVLGDFDAKANCSYGNCVTAQVERSAKMLADRRLPREQRLEALIFLTHFVGDLHQPLHVGENDDQGGNRVKADYGIAPGRNLHAIWDGVLAERAISSARPPLVRVYSGTEKAELATGDVADWARESWQVSRDFLYPEAFGGEIPAPTKEPRKIVWSNEAIEKAIPIVDRRIQQAGLRLARMLDQALAAG